MAHDRTYLPDWLQDSPYLPLSILEEKLESQPYRKPTFLELARSKNIRRWAVLITVLLTIWYTPTIIYSLFNNAILRRISGPNCYFQDPINPELYSWTEETDWSRYAYVQYVTNAEYLCNSLILFAALQKFESKAERLLLYPSSMRMSEASDSEAEQANLLIKARDQYGVKLVPVELQHKRDPARIWGDSYTKLLAFNQTQYDRVIMMDSDATLLKNMDSLFFVPSSTITLPQAYWLEKPTLNSQFMIIQPSVREFARVKQAIQKSPPNEYDMEIVNHLYGDTCQLLPHRPYALLSGEFRSLHHEAYLGQGQAEWDPALTLQDANYIHFSDHPVPKPWAVTQVQLTKMRPACFINDENRRDCRARDAWLQLYSEYRDARRDVCEITGEVWKDEEVKEEVKVNENGVANGRYQQPVHK